MKLWKVWGVLALIFGLGIVGEIQAQSGGGLPSRPTFQQVTVNGQAQPASVISNNSSAGGGGYRLCGTSNPAGQKCWTFRVGSTGAFAFTVTGDTGTLGADGFQLARDATGYEGTLFPQPSVTTNPTANMFCNTSVCVQAGQTGDTSGEITFRGTGGQAIGFGSIISGCGSTDLCLTSGGGTIRLNGVSAAGTVVCTTACSAATIQVGQTYIASPSTVTTRTSTTTASADANLQFTSVPSGTYVGKVFLSFTSGTGAGGWKWTIVDGGGGGNSSGTAECPTVNGQFVVLSGSTIFSSCAQAGGGFASADFNTNGNGTVAVSWAQQASNATASGLGATLGGSWLSLTRVQ
jgi:hypothetical protein